MQEKGVNLALWPNNRVMGADSNIDWAPHLGHQVTTEG